MFSETLLLGGSLYSCPSPYSVSHLCLVLRIKPRALCMLVRRSLYPRATKWSTPPGPSKLSLFCVVTGSHLTSQAGLDSQKATLSQPPECRNYRCEPPHPVYCQFSKLDFWWHLRPLVYHMANSPPPTNLRCAAPP